MEMFSVRIDNKKKKKYMKKWLNTLPEYQSKRRLIILLYAISVVVLALHIGIPTAMFLLGKYNTSAINMNIGVGFLIALFSFAFVRTISTKAMKNYGLPYSKREYECLNFGTDSIEFIFHDIDSKCKESRDVYRILVEDINAVRYDSTYHIITIIGQGELLSYDDYSSRQLSYQNSQKKFCDNASYCILNAFNNEDYVVSLFSLLGGIAKVGDLCIDIMKDESGSNARIKRVNLEDLPKELMAEERKMLEEVAKRPVVFDEDCPELTEDKLKQFRSVLHLGR